MLASIIETCNLKNVEPHSYLTGVRTAIAHGHMQKDIEMLFPWSLLEVKQYLRISYLPPQK
jgi:transposase